MTRDIFISHSSGDADVARELRALLESAGYTCWMAPDDVTGTAPWADQLLAAIKTSRAMLVLISSHSNASSHVAREVELANSRGCAVLPIRIEGVAPEGGLEYHLAGLQRMDAFPLPITDHRDKVLRRLAAILPLPEKVAPPADQRPSELPTEPVSPPGPVLAPAAGTEEPPSVGVGSRVAGFTIEAVLGEGGMATVFRATQEEPRRLVALKVIRADHAADPTYRQRFLAEKDTLAALEHPSIVPIYAAGEADGRLFIAMRLVDGPDLADKLVKAGRFSLLETVATLRPIADAVDYAHEMGVIHRDLKPSNIVLDRRGRPYLTDFGLGKNVDRPRDLSEPSAPVGTLDYMAPEQFSGLFDASLAARVDIYALGGVAYACLTGAPPFKADAPERVMYGHLHGAIPNVRDVRPDLPVAADTAIRRALAKNPADRYATADEFLDALAIAASVRDQQTVPLVMPARGVGGGLGAWVRDNSMLAGAAVTIAALVIVATGVLAFGSPTSSSGPKPIPTQGAVASSSPAVPTTSPATATAPPTVPPPTTTPGPVATIIPTHKPVTPTGPPSDTTRPVGGSISINAGAAYTTSGTVTITVKTKPTDPESGISRYVWSTSTTRPQTGSKPYAGTFNVNVSTGSRGTRAVYVWFQNGDGLWSAPLSDSITFDRPPVRAAFCSAAQSWTLSGSGPTYRVFVQTDCFSDPDGDTVTIYFASPSVGHFGAGSGCAAGTTCVFYYTPAGWDGMTYAFDFVVYALDDLSAKSGSINVSACVVC